MRANYRTAPTAPPPGTHVVCLPIQLSIGCLAELRTSQHLSAATHLTSRTTRPSNAESRRRLRDPGSMSQRRRLHRSTPRLTMEAGLPPTARSWRRSLASLSGICRMPTSMSRCRHVRQASSGAACSGARVISTGSHHLISSAACASAQVPPPRVQVGRRRTCVRRWLQQHRVLPALFSRGVRPNAGCVS